MKFMMKIMQSRFSDAFHAPNLPFYFDFLVHGGFASDRQSARQN